MEMGGAEKLLFHRRILERIPTAVWILRLLKLPRLEWECIIRVGCRYL
jgi:hypothetical protein